MKSVFSGFVCALWLACLAQAQELPAKKPGEDLSAEASKLIDGLPALGGPRSMDEPEDSGTPISAQSARKRLEELRRKLTRWEGLLKQGVVSKSEVEACTIEVAKAVSRYEHANLEELRKSLDSAQKRKASGDADQALLDTINAGIESAQASAAQADRDLFQTSFNIARINVERQRRLFKEKLTSRTALEAAEAAFRELSTSPAQTSDSGSAAAPAQAPKAPEPASNQAAALPAPSQALSGDRKK